MTRSNVKTYINLLSVKMVEETEKYILNGIKNILDKDGNLGPLKGEVRAAVISVLSNGMSNFTPAKAPREIKIVNELIREYLNWNGYCNTEKILIKESGQTNKRLNRTKLASKLNVIDSDKTKQIPLMYYMVHSFQHDSGKQEKPKEK